MLNRRHKSILFITLVAAGSGLLAGITLNEGLGILMLGGAFAWLAGSEAASRAYHYLRSVPSKTWPSVRILLLMAFGGCLLAAVVVWSNFNSFLVATAMSIWGMLISPFCRLSTQRRLLNYIVWGPAVVVFFLAAVAASMLAGALDQNAERMGRLAAQGLIALVVGMLWLVKGWRLILAGISAEKVPEAAQGGSAGKHKGTRWLYVSLFAGTVILTLWLGLLAFSEFSNSLFQIKGAPKPSPSPNPLSPVVFLMLLAWWPYASWKSILRREPNTALPNIKTHKRVTMLLGGLFTVILCVATAFGVQNANDRMATAEVEDATKDFQDVATKIGTIKSRDLRTTKDYIDAYGEIDPLLVQFDGKLQQFTHILSESKQRDRNRGPLNIQQLYGSKEKEWLVWDEQIFESLRQDSEVTRKQVLVAKQMAALPEEYQIDFWKKNFQPLVEEEDALRRKIASLKGSTPATAK